MDEILQEILECEDCRKESNKWTICSKHSEMLKEKFGDVEWYVVECPIIGKEVLAIFQKVDFTLFRYSPVEVHATYLKCLGCGQIHKIYRDGRVETIWRNENEQPSVGLIPS